MDQLITKNNPPSSQPENFLTLRARELFRASIMPLIRLDYLGLWWVIMDIRKAKKFLYAFVMAHPSMT